MHDKSEHAAIQVGLVCPLCIPQKHEKIILYKQVVNFKIQNSKFKIQNSKFKIQNSKFKIQNSKFKIQYFETWFVILNLLVLLVLAYKQ